MHYFNSALIAISLHTFFIPINGIFMPLVMPSLPRNAFVDEVLQKVPIQIDIFLSVLKEKMDTCKTLLRNPFDTNKVGAMGQKFTVEDDAFFAKLESDNELAYNTLLNLFNDRKKTSWSFVNEKDGVIVEKRILEPGLFVSAEDRSKGKKHACVRSTGIINCPPKELFYLLQDSKKVKYYNEMCISSHDVCVLPKKDKRNWSKISYAIGPKISVFKARDFVSVVQFRKLKKEGKYIVLNRPAYLSSCKETAEYVRATILLAGNIIEPYGDKMSKITMIAHVNPGGGADSTTVAFFLNQLCAVGPPKFISFYNEDTLNEKKLGKWTNEIKEIWDDLKRNAELLYKKKTLAPSDLQQIQSYIIITSGGDIHTAEVEQGL